MVRAAGASRRPAVRDVNRGHQMSHTRTGETAAAPWSSRAGVRPVSGALSGALSKRDRGDAPRTTKSALKRCAAGRTNGRF